MDTIQPTQIIAHRGASYLYPENTLLSFQRAIENDATMIEFDVRLTKDGQVVAIHDEDITRTTNGSGQVADLTFTELRMLDAGSWKESAFTGEQIPSLEEIVQIFGHQVDMNIEIKDEVCGSERDCIVEKVIDIVKKYGIEERVIISSFDPKVLVTVKYHDPSIKTAVLYDPEFWGNLLPLQIVALMDCDAFHCSASELKPEWGPELHKLSIPLNVYTVNSMDHYRMINGCGISGIFTDKPHLFQVQCPSLYI
jgi:glycerophosphoryl diester phosphodiesterase